MYLQDFLDKEYSRFVTQGRWQSLYRFIVRTVSNIVLPIYFICSSRKKTRTDEEIIVSLTTFPARITRFWLVIECILRQDIQPNKICVWLSKDQFPNELGSLPKRLLKYHVKGLIEILFVEEDIRSHKKYFYAFKQYPNSKIITLDDDIFYPSFIVKKLISLNDRYPNSICALRGYEVTYGTDGSINSYKNWDIIKGEVGPITNFFHTSGGGTLYKTSFFIDEIYNKDVFTKYCLYADDVWLNLIANLSGTTCVKGDYYSNLLPVLWNGNFKLSVDNVSSGGNDKQLTLLLDHYKISKANVFK